MTYDLALGLSILSGLAALAVGVIIMRRALRRGIEAA